MVVVVVVAIETGLHAGGMMIAGDLTITGDMMTTGGMVIAGDTVIAGDMTTAGGMVIAGDMMTAGDSMTIEEMSVGGVTMAPGGVDTDPLVSLQQKDHASNCSHAASQLPRRQMLAVPAPYLVVLVR